MLSGMFISHVYKGTFNCGTIFSTANYWKCLIVVAILVQYALADCPSPYVSRSKGDEMICCLPALNCGPDAEIRNCTEDRGSDECVKCAAGYINSFIVSSVDEVQHSCFEKKNVHELCPLDTIPTANLTNSSTCLLYCTCAHSQCYYGTVPCECEGPREPCREDETMDPITGDCIRCPDNAYKLKPGCGPCTWNETALLGDLARKQEPVTKTTDTKLDTGKQTFSPIATDQPYTVNNTGTITEPNKSEDTFSAAPVIVIIVVLVTVAILAAIVLITYRKIKSNDTESRFVRCYHVLCPGKHLELKASHRDTESVDQLEHGAAPSANNPERPLQQVAPITRTNGSHSTTTEDHNDCSTIPFADLSMSPNRSSAPRVSVTEMNEEEEPTSASPLIENNGSIDPDITAQKTPTSLKE